MKSLAKTSRVLESLFFNGDGHDFQICRCHHRGCDVNYEEDIDRSDRRWNGFLVTNVQLHEAGGPLKEPDKVPIFCDTDCTPFKPPISIMNR